MKSYVIKMTFLTLEVTRSDNLFINGLKMNSESNVLWAQICSI